MKFLFFILLFINTCLAEELKIGVLPTLSGQFADIGDDCRRGVEVAAKFSKAPIKLIFGDSQSDPKIGISEFRKMVEQDKVLAVVGNRSNICMPLNPISKKKQVPLFCTSGHPEFTSQNEYAHRAFPAADRDAATLGDYLLSNNIKDVAVVTGEDEWLLSVSTKFKEYFISKGGSISVDESLLSSEYDASSLLTRIRKKNPQALFLNLSLSQSAVMIKRAKELGLGMQLISNFWSSQKSVIEAAGEAINGVIFTEIDLSYPALNSEILKLKNPKRPSAASVACYSALLAVITAANSNVINNSQELQNAILKLKKIEGLDMKVEIENRQFLFPIVVKKIENAKVVIVENRK